MIKSTGTFYITDIIELCGCPQESPCPNYPNRTRVGLRLFSF